MSAPRGPNEHPADRLIRELIQTGRPAAPEEIEQVLERMATAPFERRDARVRVVHRGITYQGRTLGARADSLSYHLIKRVPIERQWAEGTTAEQYLNDLRRGVLHPNARLMVYHRGGESFAAAVIGTGQVLPAGRQGPGSLPLLLAVYSADRGVVASGYQFSSLNELNLPWEALWLR